MSYNFDFLRVYGRSTDEPGDQMRRLLQMKASLLRNELGIPATHTTAQLESQLAAYHDVLLRDFGILAVGASDEVEEAA